MVHYVLCLLRSEAEIFISRDLELHQFSIPQFTSVGLSRQCSRKIFDKFYLKREVKRVS